MNEPKPRVLVTGFNDWQGLGTPANVWKCDANPSCRLMIGAASDDRPASFGGNLPSLLRQSAAVDWTFLTLPTVWGAQRTIRAYDTYNIAIHLGLGVYGGVHDLIKLEHGAFNSRSGADAAGNPPDSGTVAGSGGTLALTDPISQKIRNLVARGERFGGFRVERADARSSNTYICNETNFLALAAVQRSRNVQRPLREAYFLHVPYADSAASNGYQALANGAAAVITALVGAT